MKNAKEYEISMEAETSSTAKDETNCTHCWHDWGLTSKMSPPHVMVTICCHCGSEGRLQSEMFDTQIEGHGKYLAVLESRWDRTKITYFGPFRGRKARYK